MKYIYQIVIFLCFSFIGVMAYCNDTVRICERISANTTTELRILRNEVYARHGYIFKSADLNEYFNKQIWYKPSPKFKIEDLSAPEKECVNKILTQEHVLHYAKPIPETIGPIIEEIKDSTDKGVRNHLRDLDGDGRMESIDVVEGVNDEILVVVNNKLELNDVGADVHIVDMDVKDNFKEIAIGDEGPSSDYSTTFFRYANNRIITLGEVGGCRNL